MEKRPTMELMGFEPISKSPSQKFLRAYCIFLSHLVVDTQTIQSGVSKIVLALVLINFITNEQPLPLNLMEYSGVIHKT